MAQVQFPQFFSKVDFGKTSGSTALVASEFQQVASKTVGAKQILNYGVGVIANGVDSRETATITLSASANNVAHKIRLAVQDANAIQTIPVYENNHVNFQAGVKLGLTTPGVGEDGKLLILVNPASTTTIQWGDSNVSLNIPVTVTSIF